MKRFCLNMAALCLLSLSIYGCSMGGEMETPFPAPAPEAGEPGDPSEGNDSPGSPGSEGLPPSLEIDDPSGDVESCESPGGDDFQGCGSIPEVDDPPRDGDPCESPKDANPPDSPGNEAPPEIDDTPGNSEPVEDMDCPGSPGYECHPEGDDAPENGEPPEDVDSPGLPGDEDHPEIDDVPGDGDPCESQDDGDRDVSQGEGGDGTGGAPRLVLNELRTESLIAPAAPAHTRRVEFVELRTLSSGNLEGIRMFIYRNGSSNPVVFEFPATKVNAGEYVVLHLRTLVENQFVDAYQGAHNFWLPGMSSLLNVNSAIYVLDRDDRVLSAVMISAGTVPSWWSRVAGFLFERGAWKSPRGDVATTADAVNTAGRGVGVSWSVSRDEAAGDTGTAGDWFVSARATPGRPNDDTRH